MRPIGGWSTSDSINRRRTWTYSSGGGQSNPVKLYTANQDWYETVVRSGFNTGPNWRDLQRQGALPPTPMSLSRDYIVERDSDALMMSFSRESTKHPWERFPRNSGSGTPNVSVISTSSFDAYFGSKTADVQQQALARLYNKISGVTFDSLTFLGEAKETQAMLRSGVNLLAKSVLNHEGGLRDRVQRFRFSNLEAIRDFATDSWLQYQYGIKPLIGDVSNAIDAYARAESLLETQHLEGRAGITLSRSRPFTIAAPYSGTPYTCDGKPLCAPCTETRVIQVRCGVTAQTSLMRQGNPNWGLTWHNVLPAAWELIPYSFLIDYFTNVGDIIQAYTAPRAGVSKYWMTTSIEDTRDVGMNRWDISCGTSRQVGFYVGGKYRAFRVARATASVPPMPSLSFTSWDDLSLTKQASVGALLTQFVKRRSSSFGFLARLLR